MVPRLYHTCIFGIVLKTWKVYSQGDSVKLASVLSLKGKNNGLRVC